MAHAATHTATSVTTSKITIWDKDGGDGVGPLEWRFETTQDIDLFFTGVYPEAANPIRVLAGEVFDFLTPTRGIQKIEAQAASTTASINLRPRTF